MRALCEPPPLTPTGLAAICALAGVGAVNLTPLLLRDLACAASPVRSRVVTKADNNLANGQLPSLGESQASSAGSTRCPAHRWRSSMTWKSGFAATASKVSCFIPLSSHSPGGLDDFVAMVIPEMQHRGLLRASLRGRNPAAKPGPEAPEEPLQRAAAGCGIGCINASPRRHGACTLLMSRFTDRS
jgi:hypothetical protein